MHLIRFVFALPLSLYLSLSLYISSLLKVSEIEARKAKLSGRHAVAAERLQKQRLEVVNKAKKMGEPGRWGLTRDSPVPPPAPKEKFGSMPPPPGPY